MSSREELGTTSCPGHGGTALVKHPGLLGELCGAALDLGPAHLPSLVGQERSLCVTSSLLLSWPLAAAQIPFVPGSQGVPLSLLSAIWLPVPAAQTA